MFKASTLGAPNFKFYDLSTDDSDKAYMSDGLKLDLDLSQDLSLEDKEARVTVLGHFLDLLYDNDKKDLDHNCNLVGQRHFIVQEYIQAYKDTFRTLVFDKERTKMFLLNDITVQGRFYLDVTRTKLTWSITVKAYDGIINTKQTHALIRSPSIY